MSSRGRAECKIVYLLVVWLEASVISCLILGQGLCFEFSITESMSRVRIVRQLK
ncbi:hypothetical protein BDW42DRAFT_167688 [Aspergillus taichungensis]|uniref:Uncharacterized protein n=1 Tax=Aspergillus taichungensis TaxID=482145 RepID=A0A2J5HWY2_9EURO|nr:hypothetical protein BDW42DRAFT_167688 [Aspergillus taichungensis]